MFRSLNKWQELSTSMSFRNLLSTIASKSENSLIAKELPSTVDEIGIPHAIKVIFFLFRFHEDLFFPYHCCD
ncbi:unnamed protein product [Brugia pahangi]|uniref:Ovule protein n=1 Tax=Brugia pahangi TaxID=6280 RepID=A0A0N4T9A0_BRUPA|nr:unnamed protein product [Brugia pahangi]